MGREDFQEFDTVAGFYTRRGDECVPENIERCIFLYHRCCLHGTLQYSVNYRIVDSTVQCTVLNFKIAVSQWYSLYHPVLRIRNISLRYVLRKLQLVYTKMRPVLSK